MSRALLEARQLVKHFPEVRAVNGIDLRIRPGICFGLLGPNGAGKTTTVEMLEGIRPPDSGEILYKGEPQGRRFREEAGIMFQATALQDFLKVREILHLFQRLYQRTLPLDELIERCTLGEFLEQDNRQLSGGQRQRVLLAVALLNDPDIVFLDEPTTGLDPQSRRNFWNLLRDIKQRGKTILLTTHYMDEAYALCDEIAIVDRGRIIAEGTPQALLAKHFDDVILELPEQALANCPALDWERAGMTLLPQPGRVEILAADVNRALEFLIAQRVPLHALQIRARNLDDLFLELTGNELRR